MKNPYEEYTATSPELAMAVSILINELKLTPVIEVLDRGAVSGVLEFNVDVLSAPLSERSIRVFKTTMKDNGFTVLDTTRHQVYLHVKVQCRTN